ncbi:MAG TPA: wax ester/triacylglycerol synthase domain-containing protein [Acidimicrobiales bacterium]|jgi:WS/DGAT/MGAT family acyltransferase|nr:wax ester/triacylglycerol synthase domain-containing protein [Acidimicrobiales bacterium]
MAASRPVLGERRMSDVEALMWNLEKDPYLASSFANVTLLDQPPDPDRLRARLAHAVSVVPRLRQRVAPALGRLAPPEWQDDPNFDLDYHIRHIALPSPGTERTLFDLSVVLAAAPLDRTRPLWEFTIIDGVGDGAALFQKIHHTVTDGEGGVRMSAEFIDFSREGVPDEPTPSAEPPDETSDEPPANIFSTASETAAHNLRRGLGLGRRAAGGAADLLLHPARIPAVGMEAAASVQSLARQTAVTDRAHSPLWVERSLRRRFEVLRIPLDETKRAAKALGGSVNDLFVAGAAAAAGTYHRAKDVDVDELRISMPVSTRTDRSMGGNAFTPARVLVPVGPSDPIERFNAVRERLTVTKSERSLGMAESFAGIANVLPTSVLVRFARQQIETVDFATSNVRGAPFDLYVAGAKIVANYPMGPTGGTAFNLTLLSSGGSLDMGLNIDVAAIDDADLLRRSLVESYAELLAAGS